MKYFSGLFLGALLCFLAGVSVVYADIKINEIAWMGTAGSQYSEWIELYNNREEAVSLEGWKLLKAGTDTFFTLTKTIAAKGYLLIERTTASAPDAVAGINDESGSFGSGGLKNTGEDLALKDKDGNTVDSVLFAGGWPAGDAKTKETMQWSGTAWITGVGTPDAANAKQAEKPADPVPPAAKTQTPAVVVTPVVSVPVVEEKKTAPAVTEPSAPNKEEAVQPPPVTVPTIPPAIKTETVPETKPATVKAPAKKTKSTVAAKKSSGSKIASSTSENDTAADQLQASADIPKENNHTKIIIFGAVAFIGMALFLLLGRFNASKE